MVATQKSYMAKPGELEKKWFVVDATDCILGRIASDIAMILMGKHRPTYTPTSTPVILWLSLTLRKW